MGKARRHPELMVGHVVEQHTHRLAKRGGAAAHIYGHIKQLASGAAHQLSLRLHQLVMQPTQHAMPAARLLSFSNTFTLPQVFTPLTKVLLPASI
jgi:hypothetical protein